MLSERRGTGWCPPWCRLSSRKCRSIGDLCGHKTRSRSAAFSSRRPPAASGSRHPPRRRLTAPRSASAIDAPLKCRAARRWCCSTSERRMTNRRLADESRSPMSTVNIRPWFEPLSTARLNGDRLTSTLPFHFWWAYGIKMLLLHDATAIRGSGGESRTFFEYRNQ